MRHLAHLMCSFAIFAVATPAAADDETTADAHAAAGTKLYATQHYAEAADEYQAAYRLEPKPEYLYATAQAQRLAGDCTNAVQTYRAYLESGPSDEERAKAERNIERCATEQPSHVEAAANAKPTTTPESPTNAQPSANVAPKPKLAPRAQLSDIEVPSFVASTPEGLTRRDTARASKSYLVGHLLLGVGAAAIGGGAFAYYRGHTTIEEHNAATSYNKFVTTNTGIENARRQQVFGIAGAATGGALVVSGILFYVLHSRSTPDTNISAQATAGSASVTWSRSF